MGEERQLQIEARVADVLEEALVEWHETQRAAGLLAPDMTPGQCVLVLLVGASQKTRRMVDADG